MPRKPVGKGSLRYAALMRLATERFGMKPSMVIQIVSNYQGDGRLLQWGDIPLNDLRTFPRSRFYGRFACFPLLADEASIERAVEEPVLEVPTRLLKAIREAFLSGVVDPETTEELKRILGQS